MSVDFKRHSMMKELASQRISCWALVTIDIRKPDPEFAGWLRVRGVFDLFDDAKKACDWLKENESFTCVHHTIRQTTITKWRGPDA